MLLSCRFLIDVANVNSFEHAMAVEINAGDAQTLYFQLIDASLDRPDQGFSPAGRRYMPPDGSTMTVTFSNTDTGPSTLQDFTLAPRLNPAAPASVVRAATQPFSQDASIWSVPLLNSDPLKGTVMMKVTLTEPLVPSGTRVLAFGRNPGMVLRVR